MFCQSACIPIQNNRFRSNFHDVINCTQTRCHIYKFNIRLSLIRTITQRGHPHTVKLIQFPIITIYNGFLYNETRQPWMSFHNFHNRRHLNQLAKSFPPVLRHGKLFSQTLIYLLNALTISIRNINNLSAIRSNQPFDVIPNDFFHSFFPVISMYNKIGVDCIDDIVIQHTVLKNNLIHTL